MYVYIYLIRREGLELRWEVRREGFLTYDFYYTRCKFLRREEPKTCIGWDFYVFCRSIFCIGWHFFTSGGTFLHRVAFFYIGWFFFTSGANNNYIRFFTVPSTTLTNNNDRQHWRTTTINDNNQRQRLTTTMTIKPTTTIIDDIHNRWRSLTTLKIDVDHSRHWWSTTLTNDNDRQQNWRSTRRLRSLTTIIDDIHDWWRSLTTFTIDVDHWRHWRTTTIDDDHWRHWRTTTIDDDHRRHWRTKSMTTMSMKTTTTIIDDTEES